MHTVFSSSIYVNLLFIYVSYIGNFTYFTDYFPLSKESFITLSTLFVMQQILYQHQNIRRFLKNLPK